MSAPAINLAIEGLNGLAVAMDRVQWGLQGQTKVAAIANINKAISDVQLQLEILAADGRVSSDEFDDLQRSLTQAGMEEFADKVRLADNKGKALNETLTALQAKLLAVQKAGVVPLPKSGGAAGMAAAISDYQSLLSPIPHEGIADIWKWQGGGRGEFGAPKLGPLGFNFSQIKKDAEGAADAFTPLQLKLGEVAKSIEQYLNWPMTNFIDDLIAGTKNISQAWDAMLKDMARAMEQWLAQQATNEFFYLLFKLLGGPFSVMADTMPALIRTGSAPSGGGPKIASAPSLGGGTNLRVYVDSQQVAVSVRRSQIYDYRRGAGLSLSPA